MKTIKFKILPIILIIFLCLIFLHLLVLFQFIKILKYIKQAEILKVSQIANKNSLALTIIKPIWQLNNHTKFYFDNLEKVNNLLINLHPASEALDNLIKDIINNKPESFDANYQNWTVQLTKINKNLNEVNEAINSIFPQYKNLLNEINIALPAINAFTLNLADSVGKNNEKTYLILLQNNLELRPTGGFMGSYAKLIFLNGGLKDFIVQDIYVPDGQILGHVDPPWPIQTAFKHGFWKLRDSNWDPDFPTASKQIQWFFEKGGEKPVDGLIAINLSIIKDLLKIVGPLKLPDYPYEITSDNLYQIAQNEAEKDFFPGSTQKKDFLSSVSGQLILSLKSINSKQTFELLKVLKNNLEEKQILISLNDSKFGDYIQFLGWGGLVNRKVQNDKNIISDYVYIVDANLGANKANCCIQREANHEIIINEGGLIKERLTINYVNSSPKERPKPPLFWGGIYKNYLRIIIPLEVNVTNIKINDLLLVRYEYEIVKNDQKNLQTVGFFVEVPPLSKTVVSIEYDKNSGIVKNNTTYVLEIQKQSGIEKYNHNIVMQVPKNFSLKTNFSTQINNGFLNIKNEVRKDISLMFSF